MTETTPPPAAAARPASRWSNAVGPLVLGLVLLIGPGSCVIMSLPALSDPAGGALGWFAIYACAPLIAAGLGFAVVALSRAYGEPGKTPIWRTAAGWLLLAFAVGYAGYPIWEAVRAGPITDVGGLVFAVILSAVPAGLVAWLGLVLIKPRP